MSAQLMPMEPLDAALQRAGGLHALWPKRVESDSPAQEKRMSHMRAIAPEFRTAYNTWRDRLRRARLAGGLDLLTVDEFCCDVLRVHPFDVYGEVWYAAEDH